MSIRDRKVRPSALEGRKEKAKRDREVDAREGGKKKGSRTPPAMPTAAFLRRCTDALDLLDELPEAAEEFAGSCREKIESMRDWADENDYVTAPMVKALRNMVRGAERWIHEEDD